MAENYQGQRPVATGNVTRTANEREHCRTPKQPQNNLREFLTLQMLDHYSSGRENYEVRIRNQLQRMSTKQISKSYLYILNAEDDFTRAARTYNTVRVRNISKSNICRPPAHTTISILQFIFSEKLYTHLFAQITADMRQEYYEALLANRPLLARWRRTQYYLSVAFAAIAWLLEKGLTPLKRLFGASS
ncbi:hypothetical protein [Maricaulis sp.]|uniref:hypothetical protein n=1 Tax=Maricaulis sp. TaxID=1486257 RepID=UPI003A8FAB33